MAIPEKIYETNGAEETFEVGMRLAKEAKAGDIYCLDGDLGTGKTVFSQGFAAGLGIKEAVNSPTFTIVCEYEEGRLPLYHFDVYRLEDEDEFYAIGGEEYFDKGICLIEWGEMIESVLPKKYIHITFNRNYENDDSREIVFEYIEK